MKLVQFLRSRQGGLLYSNFFTIQPSFIHNTLGPCITIRYIQSFNKISQVILSQACTVKQLNRNQVVQRLMITSGNWGEQRKCGRLKMKRNRFAGAAAPDASVWIHNFQTHICFGGARREMLRKSSFCVQFIPLYYSSSFAVRRYIVQCNICGDCGDQGMNLFHV